ncbi:hypothetical protein Vadar_012883 [Vaccinium darrowii]|uniref:Uncharacterized protein n=1 Tax=Vaccinium darrowii TaxID=229202 RepID=A0ACB7ZK99_9ERIC|nr:hypothetical protein Vadar_012883 [Vaccinium darrowii]
MEREKVRVRDQIQGVHKEHQASNWFCALRENWGFPSFLLLSDLNDKSKGFIVKDAVIIERTGRFVWMVVGRTENEIPIPFRFLSKMAEDNETMFNPSSGTVVYSVL